MVKPDSSFASRAVARRTSRAPLTAARRARSTRFGPDTRHRIGSRLPSSPGFTKTRDLTIWPSSAPTAAAASAAVWVDSSKTWISRVTPFRLAASRTRWMAGWTTGSGTAGSLASGRRVGSVDGHPRPDPGRRHGLRPVRARSGLAGLGCVDRAGHRRRCRGPARRAARPPARPDRRRRRFPGRGAAGRVCRRRHRHRTLAGRQGCLRHRAGPARGGGPRCNGPGRSRCVRGPPRPRPGQRLDPGPSGAGRSGGGPPRRSCPDPAADGRSRRPIRFPGGPRPRRPAGQPGDAPAVRWAGPGGDNERPALAARRRDLAGGLLARPLQRGDGRLAAGTASRPRRRPFAHHRDDPDRLRDMSMPVAGDQAPAVALPDEHGVIHRLADQRGRWTVVYFYPEDDTSGCTMEACQFRDIDEAIGVEGADVWGISPDGADSHRRFREKYGLPFTLLSDEDHAVATAYGAWTLKQNYGREYMGIQRSSFLVDPDGKVAYAWPKVKADGHAADVFSRLTAAKAHRTAGQ